jgi:hypothetical protein
MSTTFGKAKKSGKPRKAPKVPIPNPKKPNVMKESDKVPMRKTPMAPMTGKKLSK